MSTLHSDKSVPLSVKMKEVGRGLAKVANQKSGKTITENQGNRGGDEPHGAGNSRGSNGGRGNKFAGGVR